MVHHDLWDYDLPAQPSLVTIRQNGRAIPAVVQVTKMGFVFVFNRLNGKALFPIEERAVPQSSVPGEESWPTQPFPVKPPSLTRQTMTRDEISKVSTEVAALLYGTIRQADEQRSVHSGGSSADFNVSRLSRRRKLVERIIRSDE